MTEQVRPAFTAGLSRTAGCGPLITLGDRTFSTSTRILRHYARIEAEMLKRRIDPFEMLRRLCDQLPERQDLAQMAIAQVFAQAMQWGFFTESDLWHFLQDTTHGRVMSVWLAVEHNEPHPTFDEVRELYCNHYDDLRTSVADPVEGLAIAEQWADGIWSAITQATGEDELGNSHGSPSSTGGESPEKDCSPGTTSTGG